MLRAFRKLLMIAAPAAVLALPSAPVRADQSSQPEVGQVQYVRDGWRNRNRGRGYRWYGNRYYYQPYRYYTPRYRYYYDTPRYYAPYGGYYNNYGPYERFGFRSPWGSFYYYN